MSAQKDTIVTAITNVTVIDGTGRPPNAGVTVLISGSEISAIGPDVAVPEGANVVDGTGKFVMPGLIDTNVHIDMNLEMWPLLVYSGEEAYLEHTLATEAAQMALKYGVTTIVDTYGPLGPLMTLRDRIRSGAVVGPRLLVAGHIIGYDGFYSVSERFTPTPWPWQLDHGKWFTQGVGPELTMMYPDEVQEAVSRYIDLGPDLIKIGVSTHASVAPIPLTFSSDTLKAIVEVAHDKGRLVQAHACTVESFRVAVDSGIDLITHAEMTNGPIRTELAKHVADSDAYFALFSARSLPKYVTAAEASPQSWQTVSPGGPGSSAAAEAAVEAITPDRAGRVRLPHHLRSTNTPEPTRENQLKLIQAGCKLTFGTDSMPPMYEDLVGYNRLFPDMGVGSVDAVEGLVMALGLTPAEAVTVATRNSAQAVGLLDTVGTVEAGKLADLLILDADPTADISNIRRISTIIRDGDLIDPASLPVEPKIYKR